MKRSKFTEAQIAFILRQAEEGTAVGEVCRKAGISEATFYNWRKKYAGLMPSEMKRLRQLEEENGKLKKIVADLSLDKAMLQDVIRRSRASGRIAGSHPRGPGLGVCVARFGSVGVPTRRHTRLLPAGQADRQCFYRVHSTASSALNA